MRLCCVRRELCKAFGGVEYAVCRSKTRISAGLPEARSLHTNPFGSGIQFEGLCRIHDKRCLSFAQNYRFVHGSYAMLD